MFLILFKILSNKRQNDCWCQKQQMIYFNPSIQLSFWNTIAFSSSLITWIHSSFPQQVNKSCIEMSILRSFLWNIFMFSVTKTVRRSFDVGTVSNPRWDVLLVDADVLERGGKGSCYSSQLRPLSEGNTVKSLSHSPITLNTSQSRKCSTSPFLYPQYMFSGHVGFHVILVKIIKVQHVGTEPLHGFHDECLFVTLYKHLT